MTGQSAKSHLGKSDTVLWKGIGILMIVLHNYFHWVHPTPAENEFDFDAARVDKLLHFIAQQPLETPHLLFAYLGHYGVQLFVFVSAYGLTRSHGGRALPWLPFLRARLAKIYPTLVLAVAAHALFVVTPWNPELRWFAMNWAATLSLLSGFLPKLQLGAVGPWWFFSFIAQFYAVFHLLDRLAIRYGPKALAVVAAGALAITAAGNPWLYRHGLEMGFYGTVVGHLPVICLGMFMGRAGISVDRRLVVGAAVIAVLGNWLEPFWHLAQVCVTLLMLAALPSLASWLRRWAPGHRFVAYFGRVSLPLFAVHGFMREPFVHLANAKGAWHVTLALGLAFLAVSLLAARILQVTEHAGRRWLGGESVAN